MPDIWWSEWTRRLNGYYGCETTLTDTHQIDGHSTFSSVEDDLVSNKEKPDTWFRFLIKRTGLKKLTFEHKDYSWLKINVFTRWDTSTKSSAIIVFDASQEIRTSLVSLLPKTMDRIGSEQPYGIHLPIAELAVKLQNDAVWNIRCAVRDIEKTRTVTSLDFPKLHDLARHAIHVVETLDLAARTLDGIMEDHNCWAVRTAGTEAETHDCEVDRINATRINCCNFWIRDRLACYTDSIHSLRLRSIANRDRLQNEIQLSFNIVTQDINRAVQSDSSVMKTIALTSAAFVPMTFVATIFGMTFFSFSIESGTWNISDRFWIFWAVALPFTCIYAFLSYWCHCVVATGKAKLF